MLRLTVWLLLASATRGQKVIFPDDNWVQNSSEPPERALPPHLEVLDPMIKALLGKNQHEEDNR